MIGAIKASRSTTCQDGSSRRGTCTRGAPGPTARSGAGCSASSSNRSAPDIAASHIQRDRRESDLRRDGNRQKLTPSELDFARFDAPTRAVRGTEISDPGPAEPSGKNGGAGVIERQHDPADVAAWDHVPRSGQGE